MVGEGVVAVVMIVVVVLGKVVVVVGVVVGDEDIGVVVGKAVGVEDNVIVVGEAVVVGIVVVSEIGRVQYDLFTFWFNKSGLVCGSGVALVRVIKIRRIKYSIKVIVK